MSHREIRELMDIAIDGKLSDLQTLRLDHLLSSNAEARQYYLEEIVLISDLERRGYSATRSVPVFVPLNSNKLAWGIAIGASLCAILLVAAWPNTPVSPKNILQSASIAPIVRIVGGTNSSFEGLQPAGRVLNVGRYRMTHGAISVSFRSGASLDIDGPAEFEIKNDMLIELDLGNIRVHVSESAKGFLVVVPGMEVRDLGTEFGVSVEANKSSQVHVFLGSVELLRKGNQPEILDEGNAVSLQGNGLLPMDEIDDEKFSTRSSIGLKSWEESRVRWRNDPSAIVYFDFDRNEFNPATVLNIAGSSRRSLSDGVIHGPIHVSGRWPEKSALLFDKGDDHVRLDIPGEFESFTLSAWMCETRRTELSHAILMTTGDEPGEHHWQILRNGSMRSGVQLVYGVSSPVDVVKVGVWQHLAAVVDRSSGTSTYFVNGQIVATKSFSTELPLVFGPCTLGAWYSKNSDSCSRRFRGRIDELAVFSRALSTDEIMSMFQDGSGFGSDFQSEDR